MDQLPVSVITFASTSPSKLGSGFVLLAIVLSSISGQSSVAAEGPDFYREVRPILAKACFHCHGPDEETREADLRLDRPEGLFGDIDGRTVVARGDADHSELVKRILSSNPDDQMPPPDSGKSLTPEQKETLTKWINAGAAWEEHWAFIAPKLPAVPEIARRADIPSRWMSHEIDRFILQKQLAADLLPARRADPETQVRRVFLDLIGLPPTTEEADHWVARLQEEATSQDRSTAWEELVDQLLARPEYGERWARVWLDLARYADTNGYEKDRPRSIWPYRDWVINALNRDMPYDQFTIEQLAGDLLPNATVDQRIATGFHRNTMLNEEGGIDPLEFRFHAMTDRIATTGTTWLGLTVGCAQCHTHKYDPLTHTDYYSMMAFLNNADEPSLALPDEAAESRDRNRRLQAEKLLEQLPLQWPVDSFATVPLAVTSVKSEGGETFATDESGTVTVTGAIPEKTVYTIDLELSDPESMAALRLQLFRSAGAAGPGRAANGNLVLSEVEISAIETKVGSDGTISENYHRIAVESVTATVEQKNYPASATIDGNPESGWAIDSGSGIPAEAAATFTFSSESLRNAVEKTKNASKKAVKLQVRLVQNHGSGHFAGMFRLSAGQQLPPDAMKPQQQQLVQKRFAEWLTMQRASVVKWTPMKPTAVSSNMPHLAVLDDNSILATGDTTKQDHYEIILEPGEESITALRLEALPDERLPGNGPGTTYYEGSLGDFYLNELSVFANDRKATIRSATESYTKNKFGNTPTSAALTLDGDVQTGWSIAEAEGQRHTAVFVFDSPFEKNTPMKIQMIFGRHFASSLGRFRFSRTSGVGQPVASRLSEDDETLLLANDSELTPEQRKKLFNLFLLNTPELAEPAEKIRRLLRPSERQTTLVMRERPADNPRPTHRHHRGEYLQAREPVAAGTPESLHDWPNDLPRNRLGFAQWLVHRSNPLTARVVANRQWAAFFGRGIVSTVDDLGIQGTAPSHPELLDWLAVTLMDSDRWSVKSLHRRIVLSETYRQSAVSSESSKAKDPANDLLTFAPRFRLDAEIVRDCVVQAAGVLSKKRGGPPVKPLQPPGITEVAFGSPSWDVSDGDDRYRRSIYTFIKRTAPFAMVTTFDGPSGEACIAKRNRSNTPLQALTLLNDPMFVDLSQQSGRSLMNITAAEDKDRIIFLFRKLLTRHPDADELSSLADFVTQQRTRFAAESALAEKVAGPLSDKPGATAAEQATWVALSRALFALDEVVMRP